MPRKQKEKRWQNKHEMLNGNMVGEMCKAGYAKNKPKHFTSKLEAMQNHNIVEYKPIEEIKNNYYYDDAIKTWRIQ